MFLWGCFYGGVVEFLWWWCFLWCFFCGGAVVFLWRCGGVVLFLWWCFCGGDFVAVFFVVVFL